MSSETTYNLNPKFERIITQLCASSKSFWNTIGPDIDSKFLQDEGNALVLRACQEVYKSRSQAPGDADVVLQRIWSWRDEGAVNDDLAKEAEEILEDAKGVEESTKVDAIVDELAPVIRDRKLKETFHKGLDLYSKNKKADSIVEVMQRELEKVGRIGKTDRSLGMELHENSLDEIKENDPIDCLPTGVLDLNAMMKGGGVKRGGVLVAAAETGHGKSMFLSGWSQSTWSLGKNVRYATFELQATEVMQRFISGLVEIPFADMMHDAELFLEAKNRLKILKDDKDLNGYFKTKKFEPHADNLDDVFDWVEQDEAENGHPTDLLVLDYIQIAGFSAADKSRQSWEGLERNIIKFRTYIQNRSIYGGTAAQVKASGNKDRDDRVITSADLAGSKGISRGSAYIVSLNKRGSDKVLVHLAKNSHGTADTSMELIHHDYAYGRVVPLPKKNWPFKRTTLLLEDESDDPR